MDLYRLRENVSLAPQKSMLFSGTVRDNILWGNPDASSERIVEAARAAQADDFIMDMPEQYEVSSGRPA
jgi:ATP-binding cassette subfamily B protein